MVNKEDVYMLQLNGGPSGAMLNKGNYGGHEIDLNSVSQESLLRDIVDLYVADKKFTLPELMDKSTNAAYKVHDEIYANFNSTRAALNSQMADAKAKISTLTKLPGYVAAKVVLATGDVRVLKTGSDGHKMIIKRYFKNARTNGQYKWAGSWQVVNENDDTNPILKVFRMICPSASSQDKTAFLSALRDADSTIATSDPMLVFFRNGVWNYRNKTFVEYDDPNYDKFYPTEVTLRKLPVYHPYGKGAVLKVKPDGTIDEPNLYNKDDGTYWRPSQMLEDPFDMNTETGKASNLIIWQAMQFLIRHMNGEPGLYHFWINANGLGRNGKSTIWEMMKRLIEKVIERLDEDLDDNGSAVIPLSVERLADDYILAQNILTAYAIVGEESNGSVTYIDRADIAKMLARKQELTFRIIREAPFKFTFDGFLLQHSNKAPVFNEKNDSVISHVVVIPFEKCLGLERPYIKSDYVKREEVAEWLVYQLTVVMPCYEEYDKHALAVLEPYKREMLKKSMSTFQFCDEVLDYIPMDVMPCDFLYSLYQRWCEKKGITGRAVVSSDTFKEDMEQYGINNEKGVSFTKSKKRVIADDLNNYIPALAMYGDSRILGPSEYRSKLAVTHAFQVENKGKLNNEMFMTINRNDTTKASLKQFYCGCLIRDVSYKVKPLACDTEQEEDAD